jgi:hypothetical protein
MKNMFSGENSIVGTDVDRPSAHRVDHLLMGYSGSASELHDADKNVVTCIEFNHRGLCHFTNW